MSGLQWAMELTTLAYDLPAGDPLLAGFVAWDKWTEKMIGDAAFARLVFSVFAYDADHRAALRSKLYEGYVKTYQHTLRAEIGKLGCKPGKIKLEDEAELAWLGSQADQWSAGITNTYNGWLSKTIDKLLSNYRLAHGGSLKGMNRQVLAARIKPEVHKYWKGYRLPKAEGGWKYGRNHLIGVTEEGRASNRAFMQFYAKAKFDTELRVIPTYGVCERCLELIRMGWVPAREIIDVSLPLHPRCIHLFESRIAPGAEVDCDDLWRGGPPDIAPGPAELPIITPPDPFKKDWLSPEHAGLFDKEGLTIAERTPSITFENLPEWIYNDTVLRNRDGWWMPDLPEYYHISYNGWTKNAAAPAKDEIVTWLSKETGLDYDTVNNMIHQWAMSSGDSDVRSLQMQRAASEVFGLPRNEYLDQAYREAYDNAVVMIGNAEDATRLGVLFKEEDTQALLRAMYRNTQERATRLNLAGADDGYVRMYRGFNPPEGVMADIKAGDIIEINMSNPLESWTTDPEVASTFGSGGFVMEMLVPRSRLVGSARTGFGCLNEQEFVILGNVPTDRARVAWVSRWIQ